MAGIFSTANQNFVTEQLDATLSAGATSLTLSSDVSALFPDTSVTHPCTMVIDRVDSNGAKTSTKREVITFTTVSTVTLSGLTRNADGSGSDQEHAVGAIVEFVPDVLWANSIMDSAATLTDAQTLTNKTLTSPKINENVALTATATQLNSLAGGTIPVKASAAEINTGTDDAKFATALAIMGSNLGDAITRDGWLSVSDSWSYASASTITVPSGAASIYQKGDRIKWTQTTVKYGVIVTVADTLLTIAVNTDYVVTNAAISLNHYSHQLNPIGFPDWFNTTAPTFEVTLLDNGSGGQPTTVLYKHSIKGHTLSFMYAGTGTKAGAGNFVQVTTSNLIAPLNTAATMSLCYANFPEMIALGAYWGSTVINFKFPVSQADNTSYAGGWSFAGSYEI